MDYHFEFLGDERFQELCQALLAASYPETQCLPVGQPDGGRDAIRKTPRAEGSELIVYQVKYSKNPGTREARDSIEQLISTEGQKIKKLISKGASSYNLMTNVAGTSHQDKGSIDKVNKKLTETFGIPCYCWWRDDLSRRLDSSDSIKWSFPEILRATDVISALLKSEGGPDFQRRTDTLRSYMAYQAKHDSQLKFKQIDLNKNITDLFIDVPAIIALRPDLDERVAARRMIKLLENCEIDLQSPGFEEEIHGPEAEPSFGALRVLLSENFSDDVEKLVIEGAPGQGKSTVTQYLCQLHRYSILNDTKELSKLPVNHIPRSARVPFRVDLRDYSTWLSGKDPFGEDGAPISNDFSPLLEAFIAAQVSRYTGAKFSVDDLTAVSKIAKILIVLDGFDEVADIKIRNRIVSEVSDASTRFKANSIFTQIIVTSRPAAFANSPGFPREEWEFLQILPLTTPIMKAYAERWLDGREIEKKEKMAVMQVLADKLVQTHVRELARSPMQLAILLALISVQGASLPDKRTALYDKYVDIFLNRESEKSNVVRDHREVLERIHRHLAWVLHSEAEDSNAGNISEARLKNLVRDFLEINGYPTDLVEKLFTGMVERVVALVSRVQGTFEFEVQPLREYFAARYLYDTAPYAQAGTQASGTLPARFDAIARNFYWLNVTRFYAGCYSAGELASLSDGIEELREAAQFRFIGYTSQLTLALLNDYVFSQQPRLALKICAQMTESASFFALQAESIYKRSSEPLSVPEGMARNHMLRLGQATFTEKNISFDKRNIASRIIRENSTKEEVVAYWRESRSQFSDSEDWLDASLNLGVASLINNAECEQLIEEFGALAAIRFYLVERDDVIDKTPSVWSAIIKGMISSDFYYPTIYSLSELKTGNGLSVGLFVSLFWPFLFEEVISEMKSHETIGEALAERYIRRHKERESRDHSHLDLNPIPSQLRPCFLAVLNSTAAEILGEESAWPAFIDKSLDVYGCEWNIVRSAVSYADAIDIKKHTGPAKKSSLCGKIIDFKRNCSDAIWWSDKISALKDRSTEFDKIVSLDCVARWMPEEVLIHLSSQISLLLDAVSDIEWSRISTSSNYHRLAPQPKTEVKLRPLLKRKKLDGVSPRFAVILVRRVDIKSRKVIWEELLSSYSGSDQMVMRICCDLALSESRSSQQNWETALDFIERYYALGFSCHISEGSRGKVLKAMPQSVARHICSHSWKYPLGLVGAASVRLSGITGAEAIAVSKISVRDGWFSSTC